jgi:hypothetical protein
MADSQVGDNKSKKYDRQVRIWGTHGQAALEQGRICCLGATAVASEAMKNLVLGGIAGFTLVDDAKVSLRFPLMRSPLLPTHCEAYGDVSGHVLEAKIHSTAS